MTNPAPCCGAGGSSRIENAAVVGMVALAIGAGRVVSVGGGVGGAAEGDAIAAPSSAAGGPLQANATVITSATTFRRDRSAPPAATSVS